MRSYSDFINADSLRVEIPAITDFYTPFLQLQVPFATNEPQSYVFGGRNHPLHISSQEAVLSKYEADNGLSTPFFIDDGISGVTFDRPNFNRMIAEIEAGNVARSLSRLGRDYLKVGCYTEISFVERDVRYIAVNDGVDSAKGDNDFTPFCNLFSNFYAKDTSKKVPAIKRAQGQAGEHLTKPSYGYMVSPTAPQKQSGRDYSPVWYTVPTVGVNYISPFAKVLTAHKTITAVRSTRAIRETVRRTLSAKKY